MSDAPALRHAALASSSSAGWALTGPGGSISFAAETGDTAVDADDFADSEVEVPRLAVVDGPDVHPAKTKGTSTMLAAAMTTPVTARRPERTASSARLRRLTNDSVNLLHPLQNGLPYPGSGVGCVQLQDQNGEDESVSLPVKPPDVTFSIRSR